MNDRKTAISYKDGQKLLFDGSYRAVGFNIILALLLGVYLQHNGVPITTVMSWFFAIVFIILLRLSHCLLVIKRELYISSLKTHLRIFVFLTFVAGLTWTSIYFLTLPYTGEQIQFAIFLVFAGMCAGGTSSLGVYIPAYVAYSYAIFVPVIAHNLYYWSFNQAIISLIFIFYLFAATVIAKSVQRLLSGVFYLTHQNEILIDKLEELSITDSLTALYNKRHFTKLLKDEYYRAKRNEQSFAFISIDVDNFKLINDNFGHPFGDKFLTYIAYYLKNYLRRENDIIFRLGGDEFAAIIGNVTEEDTRRICDEIENKFLKIPGFDYQPQNLDHRKILEKISLSIGVIFVPYEAKTTINEITEYADKLLYEAKHEGKGKVKFLTLG